MISKEDIEHLKDLARVEFGAKETEKLAKDLGEILGYVDKLKEADVSSVSEMTHSVDLKNVFREDSAENRVNTRAAENANQYSVAKDLIDAFPEKHDAGHGTYLK